ncbi:MAG: polysaccharide deacetylase family protein [Fulvivirga sp.]|uniref:polysaccharide deacetylase family protein n=1 Tax=Fulvivirga sp. TaxID=1931237 RepID=UPI0032ECC5A8
MVKQYLKRLVSAKAMSGLFKNRRFIFVYHDISNENSIHHANQYSTTPERFFEQIEFLKSQFEIIPLQQLVNDNDLSSNKSYASLTFDDGFESVFSIARPILNERKIPYSVFVNLSALVNNQVWVSNIIMNDKSYENKLRKLAGVSTPKNSTISDIMSGGNFTNEFLTNYKIDNSDTQQRVYMGLDQLKRLKEEGVLIGNHSSDHFVLSQCDDETLKNQIKAIDSLLVNELGLNKVEYFAIPFGKKGHYNSKVLEEISTFGYKYIFSTNPDHFKIKKTNHSYMLYPRIGIGEDTTDQIQFYINRSYFRNYDL